MSFLYKRLIKLGEIAEKNSTDSKYDFSLSIDESKRIRKVPADHLKTNPQLVQIYNKDK